MKPSQRNIQDGEGFTLSLDRESLKSIFMVKKKEICKLLLLATLACAPLGIPSLAAADSWRNGLEPLWQNLGKIPLAESSAAFGELLEKNLEIPEEKIRVAWDVTHLCSLLNQAAEIPAEWDHSAQVQKKREQWFSGQEIHVEIPWKNCDDQKKSTQAGVTALSFKPVEERDKPAFSRSQQRSATTGESLATLLGKDHPGLIAVRVQAADEAFQQKAYAKAWQAYHDVRQMIEQEGDKPSWRAECLHVTVRMARIHQENKEYMQAFEMWQSAQEIAKAMWGEDALQNRNILEELAKSAQWVGRYESAETALHQLIQMIGKRKGENHPESAAALAALAENDLAKMDVGAASKHGLHALEIMRREKEADPHLMASILIGVAKSWKAQEEWRAAEESQREAVELLTESLGRRDIESEKARQEHEKMVEEVNKQEMLPPLPTFASTAQRIKSVKERLAALGYYHGAIDGAAGESIAGAIRQFQKRMGLPEEHPFAKETLEHLLIHLPIPEPARML